MASDEVTFRLLVHFDLREGLANLLVGKMVEKRKVEEMCWACRRAVSDARVWTAVPGMSSSWLSNTIENKNTHSTVLLFTMQLRGRRKS